LQKLAVKAGHGYLLKQHLIHVYKKNFLAIAFTCLVFGVKAQNPSIKHIFTADPALVFIRL
jgi:hypothetical protein